MVCGNPVIVFIAIGNIAFSHHVYDADESAVQKNDLLGSLRDRSPAGPCVSDARRLQATAVQNTTNISLGMRVYYHHLTQWPVLLILFTEKTLATLDELPGIRVPQGLQCARLNPMGVLHHSMGM